MVYSASPSRHRRTRGTHWILANGPNRSTDGGEPYGLNRNRVFRYHTPPGICDEEECSKKECPSDGTAGCPPIL